VGGGKVPGQASLLTEVEQAQKILISANTVKNRAAKEEYNVKASSQISSPRPEKGISE